MQKQRSGNEENKRILEERMVSLDSVSESTGLSTSIVKALRTGLRFEPLSPKGETGFAVGLAGTACLLTQMTTKNKILYNELCLQVKSGPLSFFVNNFFLCGTQLCPFIYEPSEDLNCYRDSVVCNLKYLLTGPAQKYLATPALADSNSTQSLYDTLFAMSRKNKILLDLKRTRKV